MNALTKKLAAGVIAAATLLGLAGLGATTANADTVTNGSLTVSTTDASFAGKTVNAYKMFDATVNGSSADYTLNSNWDTFFTSVLKNGGEHAAVCDNKTGTALNECAYNYVSGLADDAAMQSFAAMASKWAQQKKTGEATSNVPVAKSGTLPKTATDKKYSVQLDALEVGYYLVAVPGADLLTNADAKYATLVSVIKEGTTADIKGTLPTVDKKVEDKDATDAKIGDTLTFTLTSKVPDVTDYDSYEFSFVDTLSDGLTYVTGDNNGFSVVIKGETADKDVTLTKDDQYTVTEPSTGDTGNGNKLTVNLGTKAAGSDKYDAKELLKDYANRDIVVTYKATLNENAIIGGTGNTNEAKVEYTNDPSTGGKGESVPDKVYVYTYQFGIDKYATVDGQEVKLSGAQFELKPNKTDAEAIKFVKTTGTDKNIYRVATDKDADADTTTVIETPSTGRVDITGLAKGDYILTETKAPTDYNLLKQPIYVNVDGTEPTDGTAATTTIKYNFGSAVDGNSATATDGIIKVENKKGTELPGTGGMGTMLYTVFGVAIVALGAVWYVRSNRKGARRA